MNHKRVARLMREDNLLAVQPRAFVTTTHAQHELEVYLNLASRLTLTGLNQLWVADITYSAPRPGLLGEAYVWNAKRKEDLRSCLVPCCEGA